MFKTRSFIGSLSITAVISATLLFSACEKKTDQSMGEHMGQPMMGQQKMMDQRLSLNLPPMRKQMQLENMRKFLVSVQSILNLMVAEEWDQAAEVAHNQLGLTPQMKKMCTSFENQDFVKLGLAFHTSADSLGNVLARGDKTAALQALANTRAYCNNCHAQFRQ